MDVKPLLAELKARVTEELDYRLEAGWQRAFAEAYDGDPDIVVPEGRRRLRAGAGDRLDGRRSRCRRSSATAAKPERDRAGQLLARFLYSGPGRAGLLHADPHPGNFRLLPDGRLGVLDFGAVNRLPEGLPEPAGRLARLALQGDAQAVYDGLRQEKFILPVGRSSTPQPLLDFLLPLLGPDRRPGIHLQPGVAARRGDPHRRPAKSRVGAGPAAEPAAVLPADPPRDARA